MLVWEEDLKPSISHKASTAQSMPSVVFATPMGIDFDAPRKSLVVADLDGALSEVAKIVGVSDDHDRVQRCEADAQAAFGSRATASRSQPYYLDITSKQANKGAVLAYLSQTLRVPAGEIATIGDQPNDVAMFEPSGFSIAMGNASDAVKRQASAVTDSYDDEGFAKAMERFVLGSTG